MTLTEFLLARIAEDEAFAENETLPRPWYMGAVRVLAECAAKRQIVEDCDELLTKDVEYNEKFGRASLARGFLSTLAAVYAGHPDYQEEWKP